MTAVETGHGGAVQETTIRSGQWLELLDELNIGAFTVDMNRQIMSMNFSAQGLMGLKESEAVGKDCREVFTGVPCLAQCLIRKFARSPVPEPDFEIRDENEEKHLITRLTTPIHDFNGQVVGCMTILQDYSPIADLVNRVHYEERSLKIILDNLDIGIFTVNRGGFLNFFNKAAERITGYDRRLVLAKPCAAIFGRDAEGDFCLADSIIPGGKTKRHLDGVIAAKDGDTIPIRADYIPLRNEKETIVGGLVTFQDLTLVHQLNKVVSARYSFHDMIGKDPAMRKVFDMAGVVAESDATVLIEGDTGTGKDLLAKIIHATSRRASRPMVKINCASLPHTLLESELFGYVKGAFTGADQDKPGRFQEADGSTLFLDEIGDLPLSLQGKLLRVLEEKEFYPLGSRHTVTVDVRILSATNRGLESLVAKRRFREDLYYRLNVLRIALPRLQDRRGDLPLLINHIVRRLCAARAKLPPVITEDAMRQLLSFDYPGNVRQLENTLEHALITCRGGAIRTDHLPDYLQRPPESTGSAAEEMGAIQEAVLAEERQRILAVLSQCGGHRGKAAVALGMARTTLWRKMKKLGL